MTLLKFLLLFALPCALQAVPTITSVAKIWDQAEHSAFTDLTYFNDQFICCFRESDTHAGSCDGKVRILKSKEGTNWESVALLEIPGIDLRDPSFSVMPNGQLLLTLGGSTFEGEICVARSPAAAFSSDGTTWSHVQVIHLKDEWIWRVAWFEGIGYGIAYSLPEGVEGEWLTKLFKTTDGINYSLVKEFSIKDHPSEAALRFTPDGTLVALLRRSKNGLIGNSKYPFTSWNWKETDYRLGGPNFVILPDDSMWACSRHFENKEPKTALFKMTLDGLTHSLTLPSGDDTSYPGMVYQNEKLYICYYSSHEGKSAIYFTVVIP